MSQEPKNLVNLSEFFIKMGEFQKEFDHPKMASDSFITAKTLLHWAKVGLEKHKK